MPRLGHKKSRNGCRQCKARHVKCDENKPCSNCARHGVLCSLIDANAPVTAPQAAATPGSKATQKTSDKPKEAPSETDSTPSTLPIEYVLEPASAGSSGTPEGSSPSTDPCPYITKFVNKGEASQPNYWVRDLELMHHWTTDASFTISVRPDIRDMWRLVAPKQAIQHPVLMHEILAYSALHLAHSQPDQRNAYYALGIHHQDLALRSMRKMLPNMTADTAGVLFATSALVTLSVFGSRGLEALMPEADHRSTIEDFLDIFALIQGVHCILSWAYPIIGAGPFGPSLRATATPNPPQPILQDIYTHLPDFAAILNTKSITDDIRAEVAAVIDAIKFTLEFAMTPDRDNRELRFMFTLPIRLSTHFLTMLRQRHSAALAVMAMYAVVMRVAEPIYWFMDGWSGRVVAAVLEAIDPEWLDTVQWPLQVIRAQDEIEEQNRRLQQFELQIR